MEQSDAVLLKSDFQQLDAFRHGQGLMSQRIRYIEIRQLNISVWVQVNGAIIHTDRLANLHESNLILQNALRNTLQMFRLADEQINLLQTHISDEAYDAAMDEYVEVASSYTRTPRTLPAAGIAREAKLVLDTIGEELNSVELADILNLNVMDVENALTAYSNT